jgi:hypothetical protein
MRAPPARFSGKNAKGHLVLRVLADRAPYQNPNEPGEASQVRFVFTGRYGSPSLRPKGRLS